MMKATTFFRPSASVARVATKLESTPPLKPRTTRSKPTLRTSLRVNSSRMPRTIPGLIRSGGKTGSERLAGALMPHSTQLVDRELDPLNAQQGIGQPLAADVAQVDIGDDERLVGILLLRNDVTVRADDHRTAPEVRAVLIPHPVAVQEEGRQKLGVGPGDEVVRLRRSQPLVGRDAPSWARGGTDDHVDALETQNVRARQMPDVLADEHPRPPKSCFEAAETITGGEITPLIEHPIGREVHLAVKVDQLTAAEVEAGVEVAMIGLFDDRTHHNVQLAREGAQLIHDGALERDRALRYQVLEEIAGQAELREHQQLDARLARLSHPLAVALEVASAVAEGGIHLNQPDREPAVPTHVPTRLWRSGLRDSRVAFLPRASHRAMAGAISSQSPRCTAARGRASRKAVP